VDKESRQSESALQVLNDNGAQGSCWSCGDMVAAQFCHACGKVQPAVPTDYFGFFGLPRKLNIDVAALEREMFTLSRQLHPDRYAAASEQEQSWSLEQTSKLNDAYRTLRDPIARTEYLLKVEGLRVHERSASATEAARQSGTLKKQEVPPDLLEEVFELNMQLEELRASKKLGEEDYALVREIEQAQHNFEHKLQALRGELHALWNEWDALIDREEAQSAITNDGAPPLARSDRMGSEQRRSLCTKMLELLNRRRYVKHLVGEIAEALAE
jgi:molecular chaperone HscB